MVGHGSEPCVLAVGHMFSDRWVYHLSGGDILPSPSQVLSGVGQDHLPHCNVQLLRVSSEGQGGLLLPWLVSSTVEGRGLQLGAWQQSWARTCVSLSPSELSGLSVLSSLLPSTPPSSLLSPLVGDVFETYHCIAQASLELTVVQAGFQLKVLLTQC